MPDFSLRLIGHFFAYFVQFSKRLARFEHSQSNDSQGFKPIYQNLSYLAGIPGIFGSQGFLLFSAFYI